MQRLRQLVEERPGDAKAGAAIFQKRCGTCHRLFGSGADVAPALDNYDRKNLDFWLPAIVAPSIEIREGYQSYLVLTQDDRVNTGMIAAQDARSITLRTADSQLLVIPKDEIVSLRAIPTSLMPENTLQDLSNSQLQDLFAFLSQSTDSLR